MIVDSCVFRVNHLHYQPDEYGEDSELVGYEDGDYDHDYHSDNRYRSCSNTLALYTVNVLSGSDPSGGELDQPPIICFSRPQCFV